MLISNSREALLLILVVGFALLFAPSVSGKVLIEAPESIILVPPYKYTCVNISFTNLDNTSHVIVLMPNINFTLLPYILGSKISASIFTLPPFSNRTIQLCFKPIYMTPKIISTYKLKVYVDNQLYKVISLRLWYNFYYNFSATVLVLPPKIFLDQVNVIIELFNSGTLSDNYTVLIYVNSKLEKSFNVSLSPKQYVFLHYSYRPNVSIEIVNLKVKIYSHSSICKKSFSFTLVKLINPIQGLLKLLEKLR